MKKILFLFLLTAVLFKTNAQQNAGENVLSLNGNWAFKTDPNDKGEQEQWFKETMIFLPRDSMACAGKLGI
jgi:hypothetical protein